MANDHGPSVQNDDSTPPTVLIRAAK